MNRYCTYFQCSWIWKISSLYWHWELPHIPWNESFSSHTCNAEPEHSSFLLPDCRHLDTYLGLHSGSTVGPIWEQLSELCCCWGSLLSWQGFWLCRISIKGSNSYMQVWAVAFKLSLQLHYLAHAAGWDSSWHGHTTRAQERKLHWPCVCICIHAASLFFFFFEKLYCIKKCHIIFQISQAHFQSWNSISSWGIRTLGFKLPSAFE